MAVDGGGEDTAADDDDGLEPAEHAPDGTNRSARIAAAATAVIDRQIRQDLVPGLYLVATPIGNLADITLRALATLSSADVVYCEDTRHFRTLAAHYRIGTPLRPYHEHNGGVQRPRIVAELEAGKRVALVSDAGTPLVSDPGFKLVRDVIAAGHRVFSVPGASAILAALSVAGLATERFLFVGFLPARSAARRKSLESLASVDASLVFFEAPQRLLETLKALAEVFGPRPACVARELTKMHEEAVRSTLADLVLHFRDNPARGEIVVVVGPPLAVDVSDVAVAEAMRTALARSGLKAASNEVAEALGVARRRAYEIGLELRRAGETAGDD
ncbi:MAG: 16S rRNA (cytidine(1402)-2'-O)-methyltransferase [Hyphomicrobiaceae bacterium]